MENYSSKICTKCYSVQEPAAHFCDNCGKAFAATAATDGNISIVTKTFLKRQVAETRPLFWLCIIIVGMLGVFGFAQAGMYLADPGAGSTVVSQKPAGFVSRENSDPSKPQTVPMTSAEMARPNDALDLNYSVFEMREGVSGSARQIGSKRKFTAAKPKPEIGKANATETTDAAAPEKTEPVSVKPDALAEKPATKTVDAAATPKKYVRGPMGGCYYISPSGSKRYVDRGLCS